jgi:large subunit ribosomal protein L4
MKMAVKNLDNKAAGDVELDDAVFGVEVREDILFRMVHYQLNKRRSGNHKTKGESEVSGTGKKPYKQKGTGAARHGSRRSPQYVGGAIIFGPVVRSHTTELPKKLRKLALRMAISSKSRDGKLIVLESATAAAPKTKDMVAKLAALGITSAVIVTGKDVENNFGLSIRNIPHIDLLPSQGANVYDILRRDTLVLTKDAITDLTERLKA